MDDADRAQVVEENARLSGIRHITAPHNINPLVIDGVRVCLDCEEDIDKQRLAANPSAVRCLYCQSIYEKEHRR